MANYLQSNLVKLRTERGLTQLETATELNIKRSTYSNYESGQSEPSLDNIEHIALFFGISAAELVFTDLNDVHLNKKTNAQKQQSDVHLNVHPTVHLKGGDTSKTGKNGQLGVQGPGVEYGTRAPRIIAVEPSGNERIVFVPAKARAGYLLGLGDPDFVQELPTANLPGFNDKSYRMFEVEGPSMAPTLESGDKVVGEWVENFDNIRENRVHIVVTKEGIVVKRLLNRVSTRGKLVLRSDTIAHRKEYPTYEIDPADVLEIWYCRLKISADFQEPAEIYHRMADMEADMAEVKRILAGIPLPEATMKVRKR